MPLTAYSTLAQKEVDVEQLLNMLSGQLGSAVASADNVPERWREHIRLDIQCPCCFVRGAEVVKEAVARATGKPVRQACFRFVTPGHHEHCDFTLGASANEIPENLVQFGQSNNKLTRAVRELVCTGIELGLFSQRSIRDMREWFFNKKIKSQFVVTLDPRFPRWVESWSRALAHGSVWLPKGVELTRDVAGIPGFDWRHEVARQLVDRFPLQSKSWRRFDSTGVLWARKDLLLAWKR